MGFIRAGLRSEITLPELTGELIALQYAGVANNITTNVPTDDGDLEEVTQDVVRARVVRFSNDGSNPKHLGETLVFQTQIASELMSRPSDWFGGVLEKIPQRNRTDRTVYVLNAPAEDAVRIFDRMEEALAS